MDSTAILFLCALALAPLATVGVLLVGFRIPAKHAMPVAYGVTLLIAYLVWQVRVPFLIAATVQGALLAISLLYIVFGALLLLATLTKSGAVAAIDEEHEALGLGVVVDVYIAERDRHGLQRTAHTDGVPAVGGSIHNNGFRHGLNLL